MPRRHCLFGKDGVTFAMMNSTFSCIKPISRREIRKIFVLLLNVVVPSERQWNTAKVKAKIERTESNAMFCRVFVAKTGSATVDLPCSVVYAGLEPLEFINLFPKWTVHAKARQQNLSVRPLNFLRFHQHSPSSAGRQTDRSNRFDS